eukprot:4240531-Pyramimonas_sp.AAC.1
MSNGVLVVIVFASMDVRSVRYLSLTPSVAFISVLKREAIDADVNALIYSTSRSKPARRQSRAQFGRPLGGRQQDTVTYSNGALHKK